MFCHRLELVVEHWFLHLTGNNAVSSLPIIKKQQKTIKKTNKQTNKANAVL
jgi:hypothetical protein